MGIVGVSAATEELRQSINRLAGRDATVLIRGETGTGKELVARGVFMRGVAGRASHLLSLTTLPCATLFWSTLPSQSPGVMANRPSNLTPRLWPLRAGFSTYQAGLGWTESGDQRR